jgi:myo-inositol 2-dehydrogenase/D-chiro-inositol 1-dehydrogenase
VTGSPGDSAPVRLGVAGLGGMGLVHLRNSLALPAAEVVALASHRPDVARSVAMRVGEDLRACSYAELFASHDVDAVVIASRSIDHADDAIAAVRGGKHVLLEKPGATTLTDHDRMRAEAERHPDLVVQVAYNRRHDPDYSRALELARADAVGRPLVLLLVSRDAEWPKGENPRHTGGFLLDMAVHDYDFACSVFRDEPVEVYAARQGLLYPELIGVGDLDNAVITIRFRNGGIAITHISRTCRFGHDVRCEIVGEHGSIMVGNDATSPGVRVLRDTCGGRFPEDFSERFKISYQAELGAFVAACRGEAAGVASLEQDRRAVAIGIAARAGAVQKRPLEVGVDWPWGGGFAEAKP